MLIERKRRRRQNGKEAGEDALRTSVLAYLSQALPPTAFFTVFPLGERALFHGLRMRDLGARSGFPNLLILHDGRAYCIELKSDAGVPQTSARDCYAALQDARVPVTVARSLQDVQHFLRVECGLPMRSQRSAA